MNNRSTTVSKNTPSKIKNDVEKTNVPVLKDGKKQENNILLLKNGKKQENVNSNTEYPSFNLPKSKTSATTSFNVPKKNEVSTFNDEKFAPAIVGGFFVPGFGEVEMLATGALLLAGGIEVAAGSHLFDKIMRMAPHRVHRTKSNWQKHSKRRPGGREKKKTKSSYNGKHRRHKNKHRR